MEPSIITTALISLNVQIRYSLRFFELFFPAHFGTRNSARHVYAAKLFTNSTRLRRAMPEGPFAIQGF